MESGCGTLYYMAPEVFLDHYTEKADVFSLGILLYAIEERAYIVVNGMKHYGVFVEKPDGNKVPLGFRMFDNKTGINIPFSTTTPCLAKIIGSALLFDQKKRPTATQIKQQLDDYKSYS